MKSVIEIGSVVAIGLNEFKIILSRNGIRYKCIVNEVGYIHSAVNCQTNEPVRIGILIEFFQPVETAMIHYHNGFFIPVNLMPVQKPPMKKEKLRMIALCKKKNQMQLQRIEGTYPNKKHFTEKLRRQGFDVKHIYIS